MCAFLHGGHRTTCRISCFLPRCGPRTVEEFVWFSCVVSPQLGYLPKIIYGSQSQQTLFSRHSKTKLGKALPCVNLEGSWLCVQPSKASLPSRAASCQTRREARVRLDSRPAIRGKGQARPLVTSRDNRRKKHYKGTCKQRQKENRTATMMNTFHPARIWGTGAQQIKKSTETAHSSAQFNKFSPAWHSGLRQGWEF